jgi:hypothetical protein
MKRAREQIDSTTNENVVTTNTNSICFPVDCLLPIFECCDAQTVLYSLSLVCTTWRTTVLENEQFIWKRICYGEFPMLNDVLSLNDLVTIQWKKLFLKRAELSPIYSTSSMKYKRIRLDMREKIVAKYREKQDELNSEYNLNKKKMDEYQRKEDKEVQELRRIDKQRQQILLRWVCNFIHTVQC